MVLFTRNAQFLLFHAAFNYKALRVKINPIRPITATVLPTLQDSWLSGFTYRRMFHSFSTYK
jgi:hypothetical protein